MSNFSGLQIDPRCIKCGKPPTVNGPLFEMQNHLYICSQCRQMEENKGKRISWAEDMSVPAQTGGQAVQTMGNMPGLQTSSLAQQTVNVPKNSLFGILGVPPTASQDAVESALEEKMRSLMRNADGSDEHMQMIEQLRDWQEALVSDATFLQKQVDKVRPRKARGSALLLAGKSLYTAQELLTECEASKQGWEDAETLLQEGKLQPWILYQIGNRMVANEADRLVQANVPMHRVLNYVLYRLVPERPFRFYSRESWQPVASIPNAVTPGELATCCDQNWTSGEWHLYNGAMIAWLEFSQGCRDLGQYYATSIMPYAGNHPKRGLGLELVLERVAPGITKPKLVVAFDGTQDDSYVQDAWDREIPHAPIKVQINNVTRGFSSLTLEIVANKQKSQTPEPDWIYLTASRSAPGYSSYAPTAPPVQNQPVLVYGRKGADMPAGREITLTNLAQLKRGRRYERTLRLLEYREYNREPLVHEYPIVLKTMSYFQGFRGLLWRCGLRGDLPGLVWNALLGLLLAFISSQLLLQNIHIPSSVWHAQALKGITIISFLQISVSGLFGELQHLPRVSFVQATGIIMGIAGFFTGFGKGHASYKAREGARGFIKGTFWLSLLFLPVLLFLVDGYRTLSYAISPGKNHSVNSPGVNHNVLLAISSIGGSFLLCCLIFLLACIAALTRRGIEKFLRKSYAALLTPKGRA
jgi:hypothetical protein